MRILACSDIHSPIFYQEFIKSLESFSEKVDLILLAGDMVERDTLEKEVEEYRKIYNSFFGKFFVPIVAVFGNTEFEEYRERIKKEVGIRFLDDQSIELKIEEKSVLIFGTTGSLDEPTRWQKTHLPNITQIYKARVEKARSCLKSYKGFKILLTHYAPTYKTLEGENPLFYSNLGSLEMEKVILETRPNLVIHGHAHLGKRFAWIDTVPVYNVAFPANKNLVIIDTEKIKPGLQKFV
ncbi:MAG: metallophosphoesterase [Candidatus Aenigmarchaeota archaeon]|nr:metallophosphoesterase [Candidatus Aenigmarchaeota archaeon]